VAQVPRLRYFNLGGGLGIPLIAADRPLDLTAWSALVARQFGGHGFEVWCEPGDYLVKDAGLLLLEVNTVERKGRTLFAGVNGGFQLHPDPAFYQLPLLPVPVRAAGGDAPRLKRWLKRRLAGEPLAYITGGFTFRGLAFAIDKRAYITDPETTHLVSAVLRRAPRARLEGVLQHVGQDAMQNGRVCPHHATGAAALQLNRPPRRHGMIAIELPHARQGLAGLDRHQLRLQFPVLRRQNHPLALDFIHQRFRREEQIALQVVREGRLFRQQCGDSGYAPRGVQHIMEEHPLQQVPALCMTDVLNHQEGITPVLPLEGARRSGSARNSGSC
jgi:hypothetical protein